MFKLKINVGHKEILLEAEEKSSLKISEHKCEYASSLKMENRALDNRPRGTSVHRIINFTRTLSMTMKRNDDRATKNKMKKTRMLALGDVKKWVL